MTNPFDLDALDLRVSSVESFGGAEPQKTPTTIVISALSHLCCVIAVTLLFCGRGGEELQ